MRPGPGQGAATAGTVPDQLPVQPLEQGVVSHSHVAILKIFNKIVNNLGVSSEIIDAGPAAMG